MPAVFQSVPILAGLNDSALELLANRAKETMHPTGSCILNEGDSGNRFYVIRGGIVRVCKHTGTSDEVELARLGKGEFFGEMCILETLPRSASVLAVTDTALISLSSLDFLRLYEQMPAQYGILVLNLARDLSRRLRKLDDVFAGRH